MLEDSTNPPASVSNQLNTIV